MLHYNKAYSKISIDLCKKVSLQAHRLYDILRHIRLPKQYISHILSYKELSDITNLGRGRIYQYIQELEQHGFIDIINVSYGKYQFFLKYEKQMEQDISDIIANSKQVDKSVPQETIINPPDETEIDTPTELETTDETEIDISELLDPNAIRF